MAQRSARERAAEDFGGGARGTASRLTAEFVGAFALVCVDCGGAMLATLDASVSPGARSAATGLVIMALAFALSDVSGAHFNPAVTLAFALRGAFPWRHVASYWASQLAGAAAASACLLALLGDRADLGATHPHLGVGAAFACEALFTALLAGVALSTATRHKILGPVAPIAAGAVVALTGLIARPVSDASINPARSLGPALVGGHLAGQWLYVAAPLAGALLAFAVVSAVHPRHHAEEREAAGGDGR